MLLLSLILALSHSAIMPKTLTLTFTYAARAGQPLTTSQGAVYWNGVSQNFPQPTWYNLFYASIPLTAKVGINNLTFVGLGASDTYGMLIQDIKLVTTGQTTNYVTNGQFTSLPPNTTYSYFCNNDLPGWSSR
jgi:hypothetical protein